MVEESIADDFVEESIEDDNEVEEAKEVVQASQSATFSVHDAAEEAKDQVMEMQRQESRA